MNLQVCLVITNFLLLSCSQKSSAHLESFLIFVKAVSKEPFVVDSIDEAQDVLKELKSFLGKDQLKFQTPFFISTGILKSVEPDPDQQLMAKLTDEGVDEDKFLQDAKIVRHVFSAYKASRAWTKQRELKYLKLNPQTQLLFSNYRSPLHNIHMAFIARNASSFVPYHTLLIDHEIQSVVMSIRGTKSFTDIYVNVMAKNVPFQNGVVHTGFLKAANQILTSTLPLITKALEEHPGYNLVLTGHSLGASVAQLITMMLLENKVPVRDNLDVNRLNIRCVVLAPPPTFKAEQDQAIPMEMKNAITTYIHDRDYIPTLSIASFAKLLAKIEALDQLNLPYFTSWKLYFGYGSEEEWQKVRNVVQNVTQNTFPYLEHPAKDIYFLSKRQKGHEVKNFFAGIKRLMDHHVLKDINLARCSLRHHRYFRYQEAFELIQNEILQSRNATILDE